MKRIKAWSVWLAALLLIALVFVTGVLDRPMTWEDMPYLLMQFDGGLTRSTQAGDAYGAMNSGPGLTLPAGAYRLKWQIEGDGGNRLVIVTQNGAQAVPGDIPLPAGETAGEATFTLDTAATAERVTAAERRKNGLAVLLTAAGAAFAFMATTLFPWGHVRLLTRGLSDYLQFPWRFLMMTAVLLPAGSQGSLRVWFAGKPVWRAADMVSLLTLLGLMACTIFGRRNGYGWRETR